MCSWLGGRSWYVVCAAAGTADIHGYRRLGQKITRVGRLSQCSVALVAPGLAMTFDFVELSPPTAQDVLVRYRFAVDTTTM
jgi:hypothetical protein